MPHEGYADNVTNDGAGFHSDMPVSELTEARHWSHRGKRHQLNRFDCGNHKRGDTGNHANDPNWPLVARGHEPLDPDSGTRPTAQVAVGTDTGEDPDRKRHKSPQPQKRVPRC